MWPLLENDKDPDSLEARVAYHLYRLDIKGARLARAIRKSNDTAAQLAAAEISLTKEHVSQLAQAVQVDYDDLTRDLCEEEKCEWHFYRISYRFSRYVWDAARSSWTVRGCTTTRASEIMQLSRGHVSQCADLKNPQPTPLTSRLLHCSRQPCLFHSAQITSCRKATDSTKTLTSTTPDRSVGYVLVINTLSMWLANNAPLTF